MQENVVACLEQVTKVYPQATRPAVKVLSFRVEPGEIVSLLGPNGAGKTTTIKMVAGLALPSEGAVRVMGHDMLRERTRGARHIGAVLEGARNLYWRLTARDNLLYFGSLRLVPRRVLNERITALLELLGLVEHQHQEVRHFSRGMQQKLAIAAALLHDPQLLLLDEPTLGLDVTAARQLEATVLRMAREEGKGILLTTHTMPLVERLADRVIVMHEGREIAGGSTRQLLEQYSIQQETVQVRVAGQMPEEVKQGLEQNFPDLYIAQDTDNHTSLSWSAPLQSDVLRLLQFLDGWGSCIVDVGRRRPSLEEVFLQLTEERQSP